MTTWHIARMAAAILLAVSTAQGATIHVDVANCPGPGSGTRLDPYCSIQTAIGVAINGDDIIVAPGTYRELINFLGKSITLRSSLGPDVTIINGDIDDDGTGDGTVVSCVTDETALTVLDGFTITGGEAADGGGMRNGPGSPTVINCIFTLNNATFIGGGMYNDAGGNPTVTGCSFSNNHATAFGGGMFNDDTSSPTVTNCTFSDNAVDINAGGMLNQTGSSPTVTNCIFIRNTAVCRAGGMGNGEGGSTVANCTFSQNSANENGGAISALGGTFANCIFFGNTSNGVNEIFGTPTVTYSDVLGGFDGIGNIDINPMLVDPENGDFHILAGSPCIDAADNAAVPPDETDLDGDFDTTEPIPFDLDGNPRFVDDPDTIDSGNGDPPVVDMGAYEFQGTSCPWDCDGGESTDGTVGITDFLLLLAQWGGPGSCDFDGGGVGITDFLLLLANWGPCP